MPPLDVLASFVVASLALLLIPGPAVLFVVNRGMVEGRTVALASVLGLTIGNFFHALLASMGISAVLMTSATVFNIVKWLGVTYLIGTGARAFLSGPQGPELNRQSFGAGRAFRQGVTVNVLNPKVALFFIAFLPQFLGATHEDHPWSTLLLGTLFVGLGFVTDSMYAIASSSLRHFFMGGRALPFFRRWVSGTVFIVLGVLAASVNRG